MTDQPPPTDADPSTRSDADPSTRSDADPETDADATAFLFPGQGSQEPGMGRTFYDAWPDARSVFDDADAALDADLADLCFRGSAEELRRPRNAQPALLAVGAATYAGIASRFGVRPAFVAGHSLGHFTALAAADAAPTAALAGAVRERGRQMERAEAADGPGTMLAVLLADPDVVAGACADRDDVSVALYNAPKQTVVSGTEAGVEAVREAVADRTRARFRDLDVGAAFHSPVMASAVDPIQEVLADLPLREAAVPVVSDVSGEVYTDPATARRELAAQVTSSVDWVAVVERLRDRGVERYVELPPAGVLSDLVERIHPEADCVRLETPADAREVFA